MQNTQNSYPKMRMQFQNLYFKKIEPWLLQYESKRKLKLALAIIFSSVFVVLGLILLFFSDGIEPDTLKSVLFLFVIAYSIWYFIKKNFEQQVKKNIMPQICKCFGDLKWSCDSYMNSIIFEDAHLVPTGTSKDFDDIFSGTYAGVPYEIIESEMSVGSGRNRRTVFSGAIVKLEMNKKFTGNTVIRPDSLLHIPPSLKLRHTTLEDVLFEKKFDVFTDDEVEARFLITTAFMERLNNMKMAFKANKVSCAFYENYLFIGLETNKDLFSICSLVKPINDGRQFFTMFEEILSIVKLIDYFKLDQKIGL